MVLRAPPGERSVPSLLAFGVLNLDKPAGPSAHQVSAWVRDLVGDAVTDTEYTVGKAAHAGTLDPSVTGCLPVLLGTGTRCVPAIQGGDKSYVAVLELHGDPPTDFGETIAAFEGDQYQRPPQKSAVERRLRVRTIHEITVLERRDRQALLRIRCEAGTYIRKLCHHIGLALGTGANMGDLRRVGATPFDDTDLQTLQDLTDALVTWEEDGDEAWVREVISPAERALSHLPTVTIARSAARSVADGAPVYAPGVLDADTTELGTQVACYTPDGSVVCLGELVGAPDASSGTVVDLERVLV